MKILDRYILRNFLGTFFFTLAMIMIIAVVFDVSEKIDDFIAKGASLNEIIFDYYINFMMHYGNLFSSLLIFLSVILFTSKLAQRTEFIAILCSGVSFKRLLFPYFLGATVLAGGSLYLNHYQLPKANKKRIQFETEYIWNPFRIKDKHLHREVEPGTIVYFESLMLVENKGYKFSLEKWEDGKLTEKTNARKAVFNPVDSTWNLNDYEIRILRDNGELVKKGWSLDTTYNFAPSDFGERLNVVATLTTEELNAFIEKEKLKGSDKVAFFEIEKHQRTSYPMAAYILTLIGASIAGRKVRGGVGLHIALGFFMVIFYIFLMKISTVAATNSGVPPVLAVWIPNILFAIVSIFLVRKAQK